MKQILLSSILIMSSIKAVAEVNVNTQTFKEMAIYPAFQFPAQVIPLQKVTLSSEQNGIIISNKLLVGTNVKKNQTIIKIDCTDNELAKEQGLAALTRLKVQQKLAEQQLDRTQKLVQAKSISRQELDQKQTTLDANLASLEQQQVALKIIDHNLSKCEIKAPFNGIVIENKADKHSFSIVGSPLISLLNASAVEIESHLPLSITEKLSHSNDIEFHQNNEKYKVQLRAQLPQVNTLTKQQTNRFTIISKQKPISSSIGKIVWKSHQPSIPSQYIVQRNDQLGVFLAKETMAQFYPLKYAVEGQNSPSSLPLNTLIITSSLLNINDKDRIK